VLFTQVLFVYTPAMKKSVLVCVHQALLPEEHEDHVRCCAWSPDCTRLATAAQDATVRIWDVETWQEEELLGRYRAGAYTRSLQSST